MLRRRRWWRNQESLGQKGWSGKKNFHGMSCLRSFKLHQHGPQLERFWCQHIFIISHLPAADNRPQTLGDKLTSWPTAKIFVTVDQTSWAGTSWQAKLGSMIPIKIKRQLLPSNIIASFATTPLLRSRTKSSRQARQAGDKLRDWETAPRAPDRFFCEKTWSGSNGSKN